MRAICDAVATFKLAFIDGDFTHRIDAYASVLCYVPRAETLAAVDGDLSALDPEETNVAA